MEASESPEGNKGSPPPLSATLVQQNSTFSALPGNSPSNRSPILRKSGSLTSIQAPGQNLGSKEDERRRDFQRVKTVSFANLDSVAAGLDTSSTAALAADGHRGAQGPVPLEAVKLETGNTERIQGDDETERHSVASVAWGRSGTSTVSNFSFYLPLGGKLQRACSCCWCCSSIYTWCRKLGPGNELVFHTREDLEVERQQKRHPRLSSRSSTLSSLSGGARSTSMRCNSGPTEKLMRSFPLGFNNAELEELFALNVNHWMKLRLLPMGTLLLLNTLAMWPLLAWSFDQQTEFDHSSTIGIMFNSAMAVTMLSAVGLAAVSSLAASRDYAEHFTTLAILLLVTMWGIWNSVASSLLEANPRNSDSRSTEESTALEACTAMSYLYGLLPVVLIDVVLPSRTKYTWAIHLSFFGTSTASIIIRGILNPRFIAPAFVVIRVVTYFVLASFLYLGRYAAEMQLRQTFLGWLDTRRRVDRLESDLKRQRSRSGASTSVEQLVHLVKQMQETTQLALAATSDGTRPDVRSPLQETKAMLEQCLSILCTTTNLYAVNFGHMDNIEHMDIIRALINDKNALPKDWARARDSLPVLNPHTSPPTQGESNGEQGNIIPTLELRSQEDKQRQVSGDDGIPLLPIIGKRIGETTKIQQGFQLLPIPKSRRGSQSGDPDVSTLHEDAGEKNSNRSSVLSDMLQRPRRTSRATYDRATAAAEDKLLKVAYLFSPNQSGASSLLGSSAEWRFDTLAYGRESAAPLPELGFILLSPFCIEAGFCSEQSLAKFLKAVDKHYQFVPYHNALHGLMVAQKTYALLNMTSLIKSRQPRDLTLIIVAGLCHDMGHPGRNNALFSNALEPLALLYNDRAVLENYHACLTFKILEKPDCDIFSSLKTREYLTVRSQIIELILATDMKGHFETVSRFRVRRSAPDFDLFSEEDFWFLSKMFIKAADISHCGVDWPQHFDWCQRVLTEFYDQGDEERLRSLPISPLCDREKHADAAKSQMGFINFVAKPLFEELASVDIGGLVEREVLSNLRANASRWEALSNAGITLPQFLEPWPSSLFVPNIYSGAASAAIALAAASTSVNTSAPVGCKVQIINQKIKEKATEGVTITKIDLRPLLSQGDTARHRHNTHPNAPQQNPKNILTNSCGNKPTSATPTTKSPPYKKN